MSEPRRRDRIYLTGFMGSGKSTIGPIVANTIGYDFIDTDKEIERREGKSVNQIFERNGADYFRELERVLVQELSERVGMVVSLGGGTIADDVNLSIIKASGILIYLQTSPEHLFRRLKNKTNRPMLRDEGGDRLPPESLTTRISALFDEREPYYKQADIIIPTDDFRIGITVDEIVKRLSHMLR